MTGCTITKVALVVGEPSYIGEVIGRAIVIAKMTNSLVYFSFNGIAIVCNKFDKVSDVMAYYDAKNKCPIAKL